ncbi:hypothetical protein OUZ56_002806 [Daphnia magna]|uniref:Uncharacterized protein n=1 Tax=Daphnia magna TaxID=35525 RepID=A0ABR0A6V0_9CRUS|nr:hypothetical protein OUZ56_002806 [Daphnia magna]
MALLRLYSCFEVIFVSAMPSAKSKSCQQLITYGFHRSFLLLIESAKDAGSEGISFLTHSSSRASSSVKSAAYSSLLYCQRLSTTSSAVFVSLLFCQPTNIDVDLRTTTPWTAKPPSSSKNCRPYNFPSLQTTDVVKKSSFFTSPVIVLPVAASPVVPSSPRPSSRCRPVFPSPVTSSSPRGRPVIVVSFELGSGSAVLPNGLYAMGGTVAQAVWLKVDRRGNAPLGTSPLSMRLWLPGVCIPVMASIIVSARTCLRTSPPWS